MQKKVNRFFAAVPGALSALAGGVLLAVLCILVFGQGAFEGTYRVHSFVSNIVLLPIAAALALGWAWLYKRRLRLGEKPLTTRGLVMVMAWFAVVLILQLIVARSIWYYPGWDVESCYATAQKLALGQPIDTDYFRLCPNNAPITVLLAVPLWIAGKLGLAVPYAVLPYLGAVLQNLTCLLATLCIRKHTGSRFLTASAALLLTVWLAFSGYMTIPYTDVWAILFPVLGLYVWLHVRKPFLRWFGCSLLCAFGATIKPSVCILLIALVLPAIVRGLATGGFAPKNVKRWGAALLALVLGVVPAQVWQSQATTLLAGSATPQEQLSATHYLMLGMNGETYGGHSPSDVEFSQSFPTLQERQQQNLRVALERFAEKGFAGNARFFAIKAFKAYADGTFGYSRSMLMLESSGRRDAFSLTLRKAYTSGNTVHDAFGTLAQLIWLMILLLCGYAAIARRKDATVALIALTLLGLTAYLLLVEVWTRYLYVYAPFYAMLAVLGAGRLGEQISRLKAPAKQAKSDER